jgi:hypothetical protein
MVSKKEPHYSSVETNESSDTTAGGSRCVFQTLFEYRGPMFLEYPYLFILISFAALCFDI